MEKATFAAGCFWGVEETFRHVPGVLKTSVGYSGGDVEQPSYQHVCMGTTGHAEVVQIEFDPAQVTYMQLLKIFFSLHDPTTLDRQGPDIGTQYRSAVFYHSEGQRDDALYAIRRIDEAGIFRNPIVTEVTAAGPFYAAEDYHQLYLLKNGLTQCTAHAGQTLNIELEES